MARTAERLTFKGSASAITEFIGFAAFSILYQRSVYPPCDFTEVTRFGIPLMISTDADLNAYMSEALRQVAAWVAADALRQMDLVVTDAAGETVFERWTFDIVPDRAGREAPAQEKKREKGNERTKREAEERGREMQAVMWQIDASAAQLPPLNTDVSFDLLMHTERDANTPSGFWEKGEAQHIPNGNAVELRSFTTGFHHVSASVTCRSEIT